MAELPKNIHGWHWEEKDYSAWAEPRVREIMTFTHPASDGAEVSFRVDSLKGEAFKNVRKGKLRSSYQYSLALAFEYKAPGCDVVEGKATFEPFCDDEPDEWEFELKLVNPKAVPEGAAAAVRREVTAQVLAAQFSKWADEFAAKTD